MRNVRASAIDIIRIRSLGHSSLRRSLISHKCMIWLSLRLKKHLRMRLDRIPVVADSSLRGFDYAPTIFRSKSFIVVSPLKIAISISIDNIF